MRTKPFTEAELTPEQLADLRIAEASEPNTDDIPESPEAHWRYARRFYRPRKEAISLRLDADLLAWLRDRHERYQTEVNRILRREMEADLAGDMRHSRTTQAQAARGIGVVDDASDAPASKATGM